MDEKTASLKEILAAIRSVEFVLGELREQVELMVRMEMEKKDD
jgi:hypothetical protein